jgi:hypothetical protein
MKKVNVKCAALKKGLFSFDLKKSEFLHFTALQPVLYSLKVLQNTKINFNLFFFGDRPAVRK